MDNMTRDGLAAMLRQISGGIDDAAAGEYWKAFTDADRRRGQLDLYRSGDIDKLHAYDGQLAQLGVPARIIWGADDPFAPVAGAHRLPPRSPARGGGDRGRRALRGRGRARSATAMSWPRFLRSVG